MSFCNLPKDLLLPLFLKLDAVDIGQLCHINKECHDKICGRDSYWKLLIAEKYPLFSGLDEAITNFGEKSWFDGYAKIEFMYYLTSMNDTDTILKISVSGLEPDLFYIWSKIYRNTVGQTEFERKIFKSLPLIAENKASFALKNINPLHFPEAEMVFRIKNLNEEELRFLDQNGFRLSQRSILNLAINMGSVTLTKYILENYVKPNVEIANRILKDFPSLELLQFLANQNVYPNDPTGQYIDNIYDPAVLNWLELNHIYSHEQVGRRKLKLPLF